MLAIGCHLSASKGFLHMGKEAYSLGGNTFQFFTRNPRGGNAKKIDAQDAQNLVQFVQEHHFATLLAHAPYTLNACSADEKVREFAHMAMEDDLRRMEFLPGNYYNFHPGSHVGQGIEAGVEQIAALLNRILTPDQNTIVLLETMSGKGSEVGSRFEELHAIIERLDCPEKIGVCMDTCHVYSAGYDIVNQLDGVLESFDRIVGLNRLKAVHLNDSMTPFASHKDRHEKIGKGSIGLAAMERLINHPALRELPFYLETPNELAGYAEEIALLQSLYRE